jgi:TrpR-related protein YerC/YecD
MNWKNENCIELVRAILALKTPDETRRFLRDLMTEDEIKEFANRLAAARMLSQKIPYSAIVKVTGLSSTTVARVSKWLNGPQGGYKTILARLHHHTQNSREEIGCG